jgi:hypothetical protein
LVMQWPEGEPQWDSLDGNWKPIDEQGNIMKPLADAIAACSTEGISLGWQQEDTDWYAAYKAGMVKVTDFSQAVHKVPYHRTLDANRSLETIMPPWKLPAAHTQRNTAVIIPQLPAANTRREPITYQSLDGSCRYTTSRRAAERTMQQEREAAGPEGVLCCPVCNTATVDDDHTMVCCAHSRAHPQGQMRCACLPHPAPRRHPPQPCAGTMCSAWVVPTLHLKMATGCAHSASAQCKRKTMHMGSNGCSTGRTNTCASATNVGARINSSQTKPKAVAASVARSIWWVACPCIGGHLPRNCCCVQVAYLVDWVGVDPETKEPWGPSWEPFGNIDDAEQVKRFKASHQAANQCNTCKCWVCICGPQMHIEDID